MNHVFPRHNHIQPATVVQAQGCYLTDNNGKTYLDGSGGAAVSSLGHGDADIIAAINAQLQQVAFAHTGFFTSEPAEALADLLAANAPGDLSRVYLVSGGSEAVEAALKLARQVAVERGQSSRQHVIAREQSYHGNTLGALSAGGNVARRETFGPLLLPTTHIAPCFAYRDQQAGESLADYGLRAANALENEILRLGPEQVLAFVAEPVVGATAGAVTAAPGYFKRIRQICDHYGVLLILDEVMCGMGRTGSLFAYEQEGISPDIVTMGKGLGAGYQPIAAMMCTETIYQDITNGSGFFQHGHTYNGHPAACAAGLAVLNKLLVPGFLASVKARGEQLQDRLAARFQDHPHVGDIRGRGLFRAVELVQSKSPGAGPDAPFNPALGVHKKVKAAALDAGLICYPSGGTQDGRVGDHVLLAPPFIISDAQIDELVGKLAQAIDQVISETTAGPAYKASQVPTAPAAR
ncbi:MAG: aspartate aminotransferase family protein [Burkholderiaceae bacterium]